MTSLLINPYRFAASAPTGFAGGDIAYADTKAAAEDMLTGTPTGPTAGGTLAIGGNALGSYDYAVISGDQTVSTFTAADWFTTTEDSRSAWLVVDGNLSIATGQTFTPAVRKLFTVLYVTGDLTVNGELSMTARGANHGATGSNITAADILIATGTFSTVTNPVVPAAGSGGGASVSRTGFSLGAGSAGTAGTGGGTGGGGAGGNQNVSGTHASGAGAAGTAFSGGSGGGACLTLDAENAEPNGGKGGDGASSESNSAGGGAGNPGGVRGGTVGGDAQAPNGTGGTLIVICAGALSGSGQITANGVRGGDGENMGGGGSGGGSITILTGSGTVITSAAGGAGGKRQADVPASTWGGAGGAGSARILLIP